MWCNKCDRHMDYDESHGYGDYGCKSCGTMYYSGVEYDENGDEVDTDE